MNVPQPRTQPVLSDLRYVVDRLAEFYAPDEIRAWLNARNQLLDGYRVIERFGETAYFCECRHCRGWCPRPRSSGFFECDGVDPVYRGSLARDLGIA